jgi:hypothetical protein
VDVSLTLHLGLGSHITPRFIASCGWFRTCCLGWRSSRVPYFAPSREQGNQYAGSPALVASARDADSMIVLGVQLPPTSPDSRSLTFRLTALVSMVWENFPQNDADWLRRIVRKPQLRISAADRWPRRLAGRSNGRLGIYWSLRSIRMATQFQAEVHHAFQEMFVGSGNWRSPVGSDGPGAGLRR